MGDIPSMPFEDMMNSAFTTGTEYMQLLNMELNAWLMQTMMTLWVSMIAMFSYSHIY